MGTYGVVSLIILKIDAHTIILGCTLNDCGLEKAQDIFYRT